MQPTKPVSYFAPLVFTGAGDVLRDGVLTIAAGKIQRVEPYRTGMQVHAMENCAIIPPLVNAHTHLEFSGLSQPFPAGESFAAWIQQVVQWRRQQSQHEDYLPHREQAIRQGLNESVAAGVAAVGDIVTQPWFHPPYNRRDIQSVQFLELLGVSDQRCHTLQEEAGQHVALTQAGGLQPGLSPHSPYTTTPELVRVAAEHSSRHQRPIAMHLAETREELLFLNDRSGPLSEMLEAAGMWRQDAPPAGARPLDYLKQLAGAHRGLVVHGNYLTQEEIEFIAGTKHLSVTYCPRTHTHFGHEPYPLQAMLDAGVRVSLGTDSRASNPDLSLWEEVKHVHRQHPEVPPQQLLAMATANGAFATQLEDEISTLTTGKRGVATVIQLPNAKDASSGNTDAIWERLLHEATIALPLGAANM